MIIWIENKDRFEAQRQGSHHPREKERKFKTQERQYKWKGKDMKDQAGKYLQNLISDFMIEVGKKQDQW